MATDGWTYTGPGTGYNPTYGQTATSAPPAFDWRQGIWQVANRWAPTWAAANPWTNITDTTQVGKALSAVAPTRVSPQYAQYVTDLEYLQAGPANTAMPSWYGIQQPWGQVTQQQTTVPGVNYTPQYAPTFDWSQWGGQTATNPVQTFTGTPAWMNNPAWVENDLMAKQAQAWAAVAVPWGQLAQNSYQYGQDFNEAQRRYNLDMAWRQAQDAFSMDLAKETQNYQKERDKQEFELGRQQIWGRNQVPNTRWQRNWS